MAINLKVLATSLTVIETAYQDDGLGTNALSVHLKNPNTKTKVVGDIIGNLQMRKRQPFDFQADLGLSRLEQRDIVFVPVEDYCYLTVEVAVSYAMGWIEKALAKAVKAGVIAGVETLGGWVTTPASSMAGSLLEAIGGALKGQPAIIGRAVAPIDPTTLTTGDVTLPLLAPDDVRVWPGNITQTNMGQIKPIGTRVVRKKNENNGSVTLTLRVS